MEASYHLLQQKNSNTVSKENVHNGELSGETNGGNVVSLVDNIKRKLIADTCNGIQDNSKILNIPLIPTSITSIGLS